MRRPISTLHPALYELRVRQSRSPDTRAISRHALVLASAGKNVVVCSPPVAFAASWDKATQCCKRTKSSTSVSHGNLRWHGDSSRPNVVFLALRRRREREQRLLEGLKLSRGEVKSGVGGGCVR
jgi:hypothetical protein